MSELINNREKRQELLKTLIMELHNGKSFEVVRDKFEKNFKEVSAREIAEMEQALIKDGLPVESIQKLCDVHAAVFKGTVEEIHRPEEEEKISGHPVHTFLQENRYIEGKIETIYDAMATLQYGLAAAEIVKLQEIDKHYARKENLIFPFLEKHDITGPPKVMWAIDDEVRSELKSYAKIKEEEISMQEESIKGTLKKIDEMIYKENNILIPMTLETFSSEEWAAIEKGSDEYGYAFIKVIKNWIPEITKKEEKEPSDNIDHIRLSAGMLSQEELNCILNTLPADITFVDDNNKVKYFSEGKERIFPRPRTIIGREVRNCHPPASVHIVEKLMEDLRSGKKDSEDFWIKMGERFVYIRYFAIRNEKNEYLGTMELTQDIKNIVELRGEKRLLNE
ncbi:MAG: DUF438 domain-containing protein [Clostridia bacterium]|nr:DUF438 domain-containing protein [Clostridia bacterium]